MSNIMCGQCSDKQWLIRPFAVCMSHPRILICPTSKLLAVPIFLHALTLCWGQIYSQLSSNALSLCRNGDLWYEGYTLSYVPTIIYSVLYDTCTYTLFRNKSSIFILHDSGVVLCYPERVSICPPSVCPGSNTMFVKLLLRWFVMLLIIFCPVNTHTLGCLFEIFPVDFFYGKPLKPDSLERTSVRLCVCQHSIFDLFHKFYEFSSTFKEAFLSGLSVMRL